MRKISRRTKRLAALMIVEIIIAINVFGAYAYEGGDEIVELSQGNGTIEAVSVDSNGDVTVNTVESSGQITESKPDDNYVVPSDKGESAIDEVTVGDADRYSYLHDYAEEEVAAESEIAETDDQSEQAEAYDVPTEISTTTPNPDDEKSTPVAENIEVTPTATPNAEVEAKYDEKLVNELYATIDNYGIVADTLKSAEAETNFAVNTLDDSKGFTKVGSTNQNGDVLDSGKVAGTSYIGEIVNGSTILHINSGAQEVIFGDGVDIELKEKDDGTGYLTTEFYAVAKNENGTETKMKVATHQNGNDAIFKKGFVDVNQMRQDVSDIAAAFMKQGNSVAKTAEEKTTYAVNNADQYAKLAEDKSVTVYTDAYLTTKTYDAGDVVNINDLNKLSEAVTYSFVDYNNGGVKTVTYPADSYVSNDILNNINNTVVLSEAVNYGGTAFSAGDVITTDLLYKINAEKYGDNSGKIILNDDFTDEWGNRYSAGSEIYEYNIISANIPESAITRYTVATSSNSSIAKYDLEEDLTTFVTKEELVAAGLGTAYNTDVYSNGVERTEAGNFKYFDTAASDLDIVYINISSTDFDVTSEMNIIKKNNQVIVFNVIDANNNSVNEVSISKFHVQIVDSSEDGDISSPKDETGTDKAVAVRNDEDTIQHSVRDQAQNLIFNLGNYVGNVTLNGMIGTVLAPLANVLVSGTSGGNIVADEVEIGSGEWHAISYEGQEKAPTKLPTPTLTTAPTDTPVPTSTPTDVPTSTPTEVPTSTPTEVPTSTPTEVPTSTPTEVPTSTPTEVPTSTPTEVPTSTPTEVPTSTPTEVPTSTPTDVPTSTPTEVPTSTPTEVPTSTPTEVPTSTPTEVPTSTPTEVPTSTPTEVPTSTPTEVPTETPVPTEEATPTPTETVEETPTPTPEEQTPTDTPAPTDVPETTPQTTPETTPEVTPGAETTPEITPPTSTNVVVTPIVPRGEVLGARKVRGGTGAVLGARRGLDQAVLGKRRAPQTGDSLAIFIWIAVMAVSLGGAVACGIGLKKTK